MVDYAIMSDSMYYSWASKEIGDVLEGTFQGLTEGAYGLNAKIVDQEGTEYLVGVSTGLKVLQRVSLGSLVRIKNLGVKQTKNGHMYRSFEVGVAPSAPVCKQESLPEVEASSTSESLPMTRSTS